MLMLKPVSFYRIFLGLNLSLLASVPVAAQVRPNVPAQVQNTLSKTQIENLPAEVKPKFRLNDFDTDNQNPRFLAPANPNPASSPKKTQPQPLLTIDAPIGWCLGEQAITEEQRQRDASQGIVYSPRSHCSQTSPK